MNFSDELFNFKQDLKGMLSYKVETEMIPIILQLLKDLSPHSPTIGVSTGQQKGRLSPFALDRYRQSHHVTRDKDNNFVISNNSGHAYDVERGWTSGAPGYWVYAQAAYIIKDKFGPGYQINISW